jgi:hypothetical protein
MSFIPPDDYPGHLACSSIPDNIEQGELWHKRLRVAGWQDSNGSNTRLIVMLATRCKKKSSGLVFDGESSVNTFKDGSRMQCLPNLGRVEIKPVKPPKVKAKAARAGK